MNKVVYIGPTCYLGQWHFTRGKQYDIHQHERSVYYVISDNDYKYYINKQKNIIKDILYKLINGSITKKHDIWIFIL